MRQSIILIIYLIFSTLTTSAQNISSYTINWSGIDRCYLDSVSKPVIAFEGAVYGDVNTLPLFNKKISIDPSYTYNVKIKNISYLTPSVQESSILNNFNFSDSLITKTIIQNNRGKTFLNISILPFIKKDSSILKVKSFDLEIEKSTKPQKITRSFLHTFSDSSVLASGKFIKIRITNSGIYKLTYEDLVSMGISDPANVRIFGYGGNILDQNFADKKIDDLPEDAIYMNKGSDGVFNSGDYILFYADGINKWAYNKSLGMFTHTINCYSNYGYYFVTSDAGTGKRIEPNDINVPQGAQIDSIDQFTDYKVHEKELRSLIQSGKVFYGEAYNESTTQNISFDFPNPVITNTVKARLDVAATSSSSITNFSLSLDGAQTKYLQVASLANSDSYEIAKSANSTFTYTPSGENFNFNLAFYEPATSSIGYLNYLEVNARRYLKMTGGYMQFQNVDNLGQDVYNKYFLSNTNSNVQIWDITDPQNISRVTTQTSNGEMSFIDSGKDLKKYIAIDPTSSSSFSKPEIVGQVPNQDLHSLSDIDMVILTHPDFLSQANELAEAHREIDHLTVAVVTTDQVYNEFSSGTPDATAYRWLMKMLYDKALKSGGSIALPKYLLLFGRGSFDNRGILSTSTDNYILTYQADNSLLQTSSYVTDDYFGFLDDNEGVNLASNLLDIGIGRFPVSSVEEATNVVNKTIAYMKNSVKGYWKNQLCYLADDGDNSLHVTQADSVASMVGHLYPSYEVNKLYLDAYQQEVSASGQSYPAVRAKLLNMIDKGLFLLDFTGHASSNGWTNEQVLTLNDVLNFTNTKLPLWVAATCDFLQFDIKAVSGGEHVILNPDGGGIGILSAARPVYSYQNFGVNLNVNRYLFSTNKGKHYRIGDIIRMAKNNVGSQTNKLSYIYMGDPAIKLNYPTDYKIRTSLINDSTISGNDTLRAMSVNKISGEIVNDGDTLVSDFNGYLHVDMYDKKQSITTLNNDGNTGSSAHYTFVDRPNILFSGQTKVTNGKFNFTFMLPKDIRYNYGTGRIDYYANDTITGGEAQGYFEKFLIGGTDNNIKTDTIGPELNIYLNSTHFKSGDEVNETPVFIANISDIDGINRVGSGIGHDLLLTIDDDPTQSVILNDYFEATANTYTEGIVTYKLSSLSEGKHTLTFRAWDLLNNSSSETINFDVVKGLTPIIFSVYNYPNPAKNYTRIVVTHDRPETVLQTKVDIFDLAGRKIWSFSQSNADDISWDLTGTNGKKVGPGMYLYRVSINTSNSKVYSKTNKMLILE